MSYEVEPSPLPVLEGLDRSEQESIQLAWQCGLPLLIEGKAGGKVAWQLGITISGIAGQVLRAFREKLLSREEALFTAGRINTRIYQSLVDAVYRESSQSGPGNR